MKNKSVKKLSSSELSYFCTQVSMILKSGMLVSDGIDWMYDDIEEGTVKDVLGILKNELSGKVPLHEAMEKSGCFPSYIVNMSQIGSLTGRLEYVMSSLSEYYDRENFIKSKVRNSLFYPAVLFLMMTFVIALLVAKIFPIFENMFEELGGQLTNEHSFMMSFSSGIVTGKIILAIALLIVLVIFLICLASKTERGKASIHRFLSDFPWTRTVVNKITAYRFASGMSLMLSSGMNAESSIDMLLDIADEPILKSKIEQCSKSIGSGEEFLKSVENLSLFSSMHMQMLSMGQRIGELDVVMEKLTDLYENEADQSISNAVSLIEPVLIGTLCVVIGFIMISVMLPLMDIMSSIG